MATSTSTPLLHKAISPQVRLRLANFLEDLGGQRFYPRVRGAMLLGSAARGEEIWVGDELRSDLDVMIVTDSASIRLRSAINSFVAGYEHLKIEGGHVPLGALTKYRTIAFYEARHSGHVLVGDRDLPQRIPISTPADLPRWEAVRLCSNRMFEHLRAYTGEVASAQSLSKIYGAIGEAQLLLEGRYRPTFAQRTEEAIRQQFSSSPVTDLREKFIGAYEYRTSNDLSRLVGTIDDAGLDLLAFVAGTLGSGGGGSAAAPTTFERLARSEKHLRHRLWWAALRPREVERWRHTLGTDPVIALWRAAALHISGQKRLTTQEALVLVDAWRRCPQILRSRGDT
jgi:hypothetical protein